MDKAVTSEQLSIKLSVSGLISRLQSVCSLYQLYQYGNPLQTHPILRFGGYQVKYLGVFISTVILYQITQF